MTFKVLRLVLRFLTWPRCAHQCRGGAKERLKRVGQGRSGEGHLELDPVAGRDRDLGSGVGTLPFTGEENTGFSGRRLQNLNPTARKRAEQCYADRPRHLVSRFAPGDPLDEIRQVAETEGLEDGGPDGGRRIFDHGNGRLAWGGR